MNAGRKNSCLTLKKVTKGRKFRCVPSVISAERTSIFRPERAGVDKIRLADLLKIHLGVELDPQVGKSSCEQKTASFCLLLTPILQDKKQTDDQNQNIL